MLKNIEDVKRILKIAAEVDKSLPRVKAQDAKALWPEIIPTKAEIEAFRLMFRDGKPDFSPTDEQKRIWEIVTTEWIKAFQGNKRLRQQWVVIWLKAYGCRVKTILRYVDFQKTKLYEEYKLGMAHLFNYLQIQYTSQDLDNLEYYKPELIPAYKTGNITAITKINLLKEWLAELEKNYNA